MDAISGPEDLAMLEVRLPFWLVIERRGESPPSVDPCDEPHAVHAFTTTQKLTNYLQARTPGTWKVSFIADRHMLMLAIADAHRTGAEAICFDPDPDGSGGDLVPLVQLYRISDALSA
jgi:hypothetical protein